MSEAAAEKTQRLIQNNQKYQADSRLRAHNHIQERKERRNRQLVADAAAAATPTSDSSTNAAAAAAASVRPRDAAALMRSRAQNIVQTNRRSVLATDNLHRAITDMGSEAQQKMKSDVAAHMRAYSARSGGARSASGGGVGGGVGVGGLLGGLNAGAGARRLQELMSNVGNLQGQSQNQGAGPQSGQIDIKGLETQLSGATSMLRDLEYSKSNFMDMLQRMQQGIVQTKNDLPRLVGADDPYSGFVATDVYAGLFDVDATTRLLYDAVFAAAFRAARCEIVRIDNFVTGDPDRRLFHEWRRALKDAAGNLICVGVTDVPTRSCHSQLAVGHNAIVAKFAPVAGDKLQLEPCKDFRSGGLVSDLVVGCPTTVVDMCAAKNDEFFFLLMSAPLDPTVGSAASGSAAGVVSVLFAMRPDGQPYEAVGNALIGTLPGGFSADSTHGRALLARGRFLLCGGEGKNCTVPVRVLVHPRTQSVLVLLRVFASVDPDSISHQVWAIDTKAGALDATFGDRGVLKLPDSAGWYNDMCITDAIALPPSVGGGSGGGGAPMAAGAAAAAADDASVASARLALVGAALVPARGVIQFHELVTFVDVNGRDLKSNDHFSKTVRKNLQSAVDARLTEDFVGDAVKWRTESERHALVQRAIVLSNRNLGFLIGLRRLASSPGVSELAAFARVDVKTGTVLSCVLLHEPDCQTTRFVDVCTNGAGDVCAVGSAWTVAGNIDSSQPCMARVTGPLDKPRVGVHRLPYEARRNGSFRAVTDLPDGRFALVGGLRLEKAIQSYSASIVFAEF